MTRITKIKKSFGKDKNGKIYAPFETNYLVPELLGLVIAQNEALESGQFTYLGGEYVFCAKPDDIKAALAQFKEWNEVV